MAMPAAKFSTSNSQNDAVASFSSRANTPGLGGFWKSPFRVLMSQPDRLLPCRPAKPDSCRHLPDRYVGLSVDPRLITYCCSGSIWVRLGNVKIAHELALFHMENLLGHNIYSDGAMSAEAAKPEFNKRSKICLGHECILSYMHVCSSRMDIS